MKNKFLAVACLHMAVAISLGALGAHKLKTLLTPDQLSAFKTGVEYHIFHGLALLIVFSSPWFEQLKGQKTIGWLFNLGILFFSGSIYLLSTRDLTGLNTLAVLGPVTPLGGLCFIIGWLLLAFKLIQRNKIA